MNSAASERIYQIIGAIRGPSSEALWEDGSWDGAETAEISHFRPEGSSHRPVVEARLVYTADALHGIFRVEDRYVRCTRTEFFAEVWKDSCVEFFVQPSPGKGYFNFEFNCGGAFLCCYIIDPARGPGGFKEFTRLTPEIGRLVTVRSSLPQKILTEVTEPLTWTLRFTIPFGVFTPYIGPLTPQPGDRWRGNFFKCADESSHPHWASWSPVDQLNFHLPHCFGTLVFAHQNSSS